MKTLANFSKSSLSKSETKQVTGGIRCSREIVLNGVEVTQYFNVYGNRCPDIQ